MVRFVTLGLLVALTGAASAGDAPPDSPVVTPPTTTTPPDSPAVTPPTAKAYALDSAKSILFVIVKNDPSSLLSGLAHDHAIGATGWTGAVTWPPDATGACKVDITVPVSGLQVDPPGYRAKAGLKEEEPLPPGDYVKIKENLSGSRQLDAKTYPNITFKGTSCRGTGTKYMVQGDLTLRGTTRQVLIPMDISADDAALKATGKFTIRGSDYGMAPFSAVGGTLRNQDSLTFVIEVKS